MDRNPIRRNYLKIFSLPVALMILATTILVLQFTSHLRSINRELSGIRISTRLLDVMTSLQNLRDLTIVESTVNSQTKPSPGMISLKNELDREIEMIITNLTNPLIRVYGLENILHELQHYLSQSREDGEKKFASNKKFNFYIDTISGIIRQNADKSGLILDPEFKSYYLIELITRHIPSQILTLGSLRYNGIGLLVDKDKSTNRGIIIERQIGSIQNQYKDIENNINFVLLHNPDFEEIIVPLQKNAQLTSSHFIALNLDIKNNIINSNSKVGNYINTGNRAIDSYLGIYKAAHLKLVNLLQQRRLETRVGLAIGLLSMITALGLLLYLFLSFYHKERQLFFTLLEERDLNLNLVESLPGLFYLIDARENFVCWNKEFEKITGYSSSEIAALHPTDLAAEETKDILQKKITKVFREGQATMEGEILTKKGEKHPYYATGNLIHLKDEPFIVGFAINISERKNLENELLYANKLLNTQLETSPDGILIVDRNMRMLNWNRRFLEIWQIPQQVMETGDSRAALQAVQGQVENPDDFVNEIERLYKNLEEPEDGREITLKDGRFLERYSRGARDSDNACCWARVWHYHDITNRKKIEHQLRKLSITDSLTNAFNRAKFGEDLKWLQDQANRYHHPFTVISFDIDRFKKINDTFGHDVGDEVLKQIVTVVCGSVRQTDNLYRCGGEEFNILLPQTALEGGKKEAERICRKIARTNFISAGHITVSMGVARYRQGEELRNFLKRLDESLYQAKNKGRNRVEVERGDS